MKRRDLLKTGLAMAGASTIALTGCSKKETLSSENIDIIPKQTSRYEFSCPLPFNYKTIDEMAEFNSTIKKSKIAILHNNIPKPLVDRYNGFIHIIRGGENKSIKSLDDFGKYVKHAISNGFQFVYLMNSTKSFSELDFLAFKDNFLRLLEFLNKVGCRDIKVGCSQIADALEEYAPKEFNWQVSTCYELHNITQYENLFKIYPKFNFMDIAHDETQNFDLLRNLRKMFPDKKIEIMINEGCPKGCPQRITRACKKNCKIYLDKRSIIDSFVKVGSIFPWDIEYYSAIGINNFKYVVSGWPDGKTRANYSDFTELKNMLEILENGYENYTFEDLYIAYYRNTSLLNERNRKLKLTEIIPYFPNIKYFIKNGGMCAVRCKAQCNYCFECAKKLEQVLSLV